MVDVKEILNKLNERGYQQYIKHIRDNELIVEIDNTGVYQDDVYLVVFKNKLYILNDRSNAIEEIKNIDWSTSPTLLDMIGELKYRTLTRVEENGNETLIYKEVYIESNSYCVPIWDSEEYMGGENEVIAFLNENGRYLDYNPIVHWKTKWMNDLSDVKSIIDKKEIKK